MEDTSDSSDQQLKDVLSQWKFEQVPVQSDGNCLFTAVSLSLLQHSDQTVFNTIGIDQNFDALLISQILRKHVVQEWLGDNSEYYQKSFDIISSLSALAPIWISCWRVSFIVVLHVCWSLTSSWL